MPASTTSSARRRFDLGGEWRRFVNAEEWDAVHVPSSLRPSGTYLLRRTILLPALGADRAFLCFSGIAYHGTAAVNSQPVGEVGAYIPYELEISRTVRQGENRIEVTIFDLVPGPAGQGKDDLAIGVNPGWEAYGGIIRDVWIEFRPQAYIENLRLAYELNADFSRAVCKVRVECKSGRAGTGAVAISLHHNLTEVAHATGSANADLEFAVQNPLLWSTGSPHLHTLTATLQADGTTDGFKCRTGFRHFAIQGRQFIWNGKPLILQGVCRHDMWLDQGFTLSKEQMRADMTAIKRMGANFVRLVHYPHHRYIIDLAEELGLLVTEEPGFWQVEFPTMPRSEVDAGLRILEGAIRRDWNSPAVFGWLLGNESRLTVEYLREGKAMCNRLDPLARPVSFANSTAKEKAKVQFEQAGLDFFSQHLYDFEDEKFEITADFYGDEKPLIIDEWGWEDAGSGEIFWDRNFDHLLDGMQTGKIAGHSFWSWNDVRQYARADWPTYNGILHSGVVTESRTPYAELYTRLSRLFQNQQEHPENAIVGHTVPSSDAPAITPLRIAIAQGRGRVEPLDLQPIVDSDSGRAAWASLEAAMAAFWPKTKMAREQWDRTGKRLRFWRSASSEVAGLPFAFAMKDGFACPVVVTRDAPELTIPVGRDCKRLYVLGDVTFPSGYPLAGKIGETAATIELRYRNGGSERVPLRNGFEVARSNLIDNATRIEPLALNAPRALLFEKDPAREHYQILLFSFAAREPVAELKWRFESGSPLAIFGVSTDGGNG